MTSLEKQALISVRGISSHSVIPQQQKEIVQEPSKVEYQRTSTDKQAVVAYGSHFIIGDPVSCHKPTSGVEKRAQDYGKKMRTLKENPPLMDFVFQ